MQDNAPCHTSKQSMNWFKEQNIEVLSCPPSNLDLNIIENVWYYLESKVRKIKSHFKDVEELWNMVEKEWYKIPKDYIKKPL